MSFPALYYHFSSDPGELSDICQTALNFKKLIAVVLVNPVLVALGIALWHWNSIIYFR